MPKLMCMTRLSSLPLNKPIIVEPMQAFPLVKDLVTDVSWNFQVKKGIEPFRPCKPDLPDRAWRMAQADVDRVQEFRKCIECFLCHPSDNIGSILAACEYAGRNGKKFLTALAVAYQVLCRLCDVAPVRAKGKEGAWSQKRRTRPTILRTPSH